MISCKCLRIILLLGIAWVTEMLSNFCNASLYLVSLAHAVHSGTTVTLYPYLIADIHVANTQILVLTPVIYNESILSDINNSCNLVSLKAEYQFLVIIMSLSLSINALIGS